MKGSILKCNENIFTWKGSSLEILCQKDVKECPCNNEFMLDCNELY